MRHMDKSSLKWNWSLLGRGVFLLNYEVYLGGNFSLEVGAGITYEDFLFEFTKSEGGDSIQQFSSNENSSQFGSPSPKICGEGGLKYYPGGYDNMEGFYLEGMLSYRSYSYPNPAFSPVINGNGFTPGYKFLDEQLKFGYIATSWFSDVTGEFYIGVGIRNATVDTYQDATPYTIAKYGPGFTTVVLHTTYPQVLLGFKLDYMF
jgi:hypothetical protein